MLTPNYTRRSHALLLSQTTDTPITVLLYVGVTGDQVHELKFAGQVLLASEPTFQSFVVVLFACLEASPSGAEEMISGPGDEI